MKKFLISILSIFLLVGCGSSSKNAAWNENERAIIKEYLYDVELPKPEIKDLPELTWNGLTNAASLYGGISSASILDAYASKFSKEWKVTKFDSEEEYYYYGQIGLNLEVGKRYVTVQFGGLDSSGNITSDGTGTFAAIYFDQFLYSWPKDYIDLLLNQTEEIVNIPAFVNATHYGVNDSFIDLGILAVACLGTDESSITKYSNLLKDNGFTYEGIDEYDYESYLSRGKTVKVGLNYDSEYQCLDMMFAIFEPQLKQWPTQEIKNAIKTYIGSEEVVPPYEILDEEGYYILRDNYFYDYGYIGIYCHTIHEIAKEQYNITLLTAGWSLIGEKEDGYVDYLSPNESLAVSIKYDEDESCLEILVYNPSDSFEEFICSPLNRATIGLGVNKIDSHIYIGSSKNSVTQLELKVHPANSFNVYFNTQTSKFFSGVDVGITIVVTDKNGEEIGVFYDNCFCFRDGPHFIKFVRSDCVRGNRDAIDLFLSDYKSTGGENYQVYIYSIRFN